MMRAMPRILALAAAALALGWSLALATASPALADHGRVTIVSPKDGATVAGPDVTLELAVQNLAITDQATQAENAHQGHFHITVNKRPFVAVYGNRVTFKGLPAGDHEIKVEPVLSMHMKPVPGTQPLTVKFKTTAQPPAAAAAPSGTPKITVQSPAAGATVAGDTVTLKLVADSFRITDQGSDPKAKNEGHFHITLDSRPFVAWTTDTLVFKNVPPGQHNLRVEPVTNGHDPILELPAMNVRFSTAGAAAAALPRTGAPGVPLDALAAAGVFVLGAGLLVRRRSST